MSWVNDLASGLGIPAGAATLAVAMYAACAAAEKAARPEALKDIGRILKDPSWSRSVRPSAIIERVFVLTFGDRHLSWRCVGLSVLFTVSAFLVLLTVYHLTFGVEVILPFFTPSAILPFFSKSYVWVDGVNVTIVRSASCVGVVLLGVIPDYVALGKTRMLLRRVQNETVLSSGCVIIGDIILSAAISVLFAVGVSLLVSYSLRVHVFGMYANEIEIGFMPLTGAIVPGDHGSLTIRMVGSGNAWETAKTVLGNILHAVSSGPGAAPLLSVLASSTLFTSVWTILILLSAAVLKLLIRLQRFTAWFFDVDKHPVQAIGIVAGALVMIGSLIWSVVRAMI